MMFPAPTTAGLVQAILPQVLIAFSNAGKNGETKRSMTAALDKRSIVYIVCRVDFSAILCAAALILDLTISLDMSAPRSAATRYILACSAVYTEL